MGVEFNVCCAACGQARGVSANEQPRLGVHLAQAAEAVGFKALFVGGFSKVVIFCSDRCIDHNRTKSGGIRARLMSPDAVTLSTVKPPRNMRVKVPAVAEIREDG